MELQTAKGVRDIPPEEKIIKNQIVNTLVTVFELYGFDPLETPLLERYETLAAKFAAGEASDALKETFKLKDQGNRDLGLRFDLTVPLARFMAMNPMLKMPFKRYEVGPVFRDGPIKAGSVRQFWQCDIDSIGSTSLLADAEILSVIGAVFEALKLEVVIKVNNRQLLSGILAQCNIADQEQAIITIDKLDKIGPQGVSAELQQKGFSSAQIKAIFSLIRPSISLAELKPKLQNAAALQGLAELEELYSYTAPLGIKNIIFDVSLARGLAYYTGTVYEVFLKDNSFTSSLVAGGRWDNMIGKFGGGNREVPAVGAAFGIDRIMMALSLKRKDSIKKTQTLVYVIPLNTVEQSLKIAQELRKKGLRTSVSLGKKGLSKNLEYAASLKIKYTLIIGEDELKQQKVLLRDLESGTEELLTVKGVIRKLK